MPARSVQRAARPRPTGLVAAIISVALLAGACGSNNNGETGTTAPEDPVATAQARVGAAEEGVSVAQSALDSAREDFCGAAEGYVDTLDRYGRVFIDRSATVGDVQTLGADLVEPRDEVVAAADAVQTANDGLAAAQQELVDAQSALAAVVASASSVSPSPTTETTITPTPLVPAATIERVQLAEEDLARTARGINADTTLVDAGAAYNSAALALEIAWLKLLDDAECFSEERRSEAVARLTAYTTALQTDLQRAGYDPGPIDGVYGPQTVAAAEQLQTDSGLPVTGFVDEATARALKEKLDSVGQQEATQTAALQTILTLTGFWDGAIDGQWTDALAKALIDFQTALGVEPTGAVDAATVAAFHQALAALEAAATSTVAPTTVTATAPTTVTMTAPTTVTTTDPTTVTTTAPTRVMTTDPATATSGETSG